MTTLVELLKEAENASKKGFKKGLWQPHKSVEGGNDTIAYGHKLDDREQAGGFIRLADGTRHFLKDGGLTEEQANALLLSDIQEHRAIAERDWDDANPDTPFSSLAARDQDVLTELTFNIGTLRNKKGKFGWPNLAEGIIEQDIDKIKKEVSRTFDGKKLNKRTAMVRDFIDNPDTIQEGDVLTAPLVDIEGEVIASIQSQLEQENVAQTGSESLSEPSTDVAQYSEEEERIIQDMMNELQGIQQEEPQYTAEEEDIIEQMMLDIQHKGLAFEEPTTEPTEQELIEEIYG